MKSHIKNQMSEEMLAIVSETPRWLLRAGTTVFACILLLFLTATWVIKYPEVLKGNTVVTTKIPPIRVVSPARGRMVRLFAKEGMIVKKGDALAESESTLSSQNIHFMKEIIDQTNAFLRNNQGQIIFPSSDFVWGDLQKDFNVLRQNYLDYKRLQSDTYHQKLLEVRKQQADELKEMLALHERQQKLSNEEFANIEEKLRIDEEMYKKGVNSKYEQLANKNTFLKKSRELEEFEKSRLLNSLRIKEINQEILEITQLQMEKKRQCLDNMQKSLSNIDNNLQDWQQNYLITAPSDGKLFFLKNLTENQYVVKGDTMFSVMPIQVDYIATIDIPVLGMGKARIGQKVIIKLDDFPYQEFGMLEGQVEEVYPSLNVRYYRVAVALPNGLKSTYKHEFTIKSEMTGTAEIVTADLRLIERAFYGLRKLL